MTIAKNPLRRNLGILGMLLPALLLLATTGELESSISHYYYTSGSVFFVGFMWAFGIFLFSYRGYEEMPLTYLNDNWLTNYAGVFAIIVAVLPTSCFGHEFLVPNGHDSSLFGTIHLVSAGIFLCIMGWMSFNRFTIRDPEKAYDKRRDRQDFLYRLSGIVVWLMVLTLLIEFAIQRSFTQYDVFAAETIALEFFGVSWLVKSKSLKTIGL